MDSLITFDEAVGFLKNPPSLSPRPDFLETLCAEKPYGKVPQATHVPLKTDPWMVRHGLIPDGLCAS